MFRVEGLGFREREKGECKVFIYIHSVLQCCADEDNATCTLANCQELEHMS